ncbi:hypothetical protein VNO78_21634 [Psophocarpus tetragonolobus]|uniref:Ribonuclease II winged helix domain-containing protein n=1 Tax=Psophocarpus tetragonolobus TaxID=3891 RepID=A0AAN9SFL3_PSOTE
MDPSLLEFAWVELLEKNKSIIVEVAEIIFGSSGPFRAIFLISFYQKMKSTLLYWRLKDVVPFIDLN